MKNTKNWTDEEDLYLLNFGDKLTCRELQERLCVSRSQLDHRCKILGVKPKPVISKRKNLTQAEKILCLEHPYEAHKILGIHARTVSRVKRQILNKQILFNDRTPISVPSPSMPTRSLINFVGFNDDKQPAESTWTPEDDRLLIKRISNNSIDKVAELFEQSEEQIKERLHHVLKEEKAKINEILFQFQGMTAGQIRQMKLIYSYSPKSAVRYCEAIREYRNKAAYTPARIRGDR